MTAQRLPSLSPYIRLVPIHYSPVPGIEATVQWLLEHGYPPLPIASQQCPYTYPRTVLGKTEQGSYCPVNQRLEPLGLFTGKNPSYFHKQQPRLLRHRVYTERLPTAEEIKRWFEHPQVGVATLGGWQQTVWVDLDAKCFGSREECRQVGEEWLDFIPALRTGFVERTQSGGWRLAVRCEQMPTFSKVAFSAGGALIGEVLGHGVPAVLAPTIGPQGPYQTVHQADPVWVESLASISLYPASVRTASPTYRHYKHAPIPTRAGRLSLQSLFSQQVQQLWQSAGTIVLGQRSDVFVKVAREAFGWERWLSEHGYQADTTAESLCYSLAAQLGLEDDRFQRLLNSHSAGRSLQDSYPACHFRGGDEACEKWVRYALKSL